MIVWNIKHLIIRMNLLTLNYRREEQKIKMTEYKELWYALLLSITCNLSADESLKIMGEHLHTEGRKVKK